MDVKEIIPFWDEEAGGVRLPLLDIVITDTRLAEGVTYKKAVSAAKKAGLRLPFYDEAYVILWQIRKIDYLLSSHGKEKVSQSLCWTDTQRDDDNVYAFSGNGTVGYAKKDAAGVAIGVKSV